MAGRGESGSVGQEAGQVSEPLTVESAFRLGVPGPATRARILAGPGLSGAVGAADRGVALVVEGVVGDVVLLDVLPDLLLGPVRERVELPEAEALVPRELGCAG